MALPESDRPSCPATEEAGRRRSQHYIREGREASLGLLRAGLRGAVRRPSVTLLSQWGAFLELWQLISHRFHCLSIVCRTPNLPPGCFLEELPFPEIALICSLLRYLFLLIVTKHLNSSIWCCITDLAALPPVAPALPTDSSPPLLFMTIELLKTKINWDLT